jgi:O-antigen ligase
MGVFGNPNDLGALALLQLSMAGALFVGHQRQVVKVGLGILIAGFPVLILFTQSRASFIALLLFGVLALHGRLDARRILPLVMVGAVAVAFAPADLWERLSGLGKMTAVHRLEEVDPEGSAVARFHILVVASEIIQDHPAFGVGVGTYNVVHGEYAPWVRKNIPTGARGKRDTHNTYANVAAETGLPGLGFFLLIVGSALHRIQRVRRRARKLLPSESRQLYFLQIGMIAFLVNGFFEGLADLSFLYLHLALMMALSDIVAQRYSSVRLAAARHAGPSGDENAPTGS